VCVYVYVLCCLAFEANDGNQNLLTPLMRFQVVILAVPKLRLPRVPRRSVFMFAVPHGFVLCLVGGSCSCSFLLLFFFSSSANSGAGSDAAVARPEQPRGAAELQGRLRDKRAFPTIMLDSFIS
jgi:hypothetical protein